MKCPVCGSDHITHSYRRGVEKMYRYIYPRTPYRCKECWSRFWVFENPFKTLASRVVAGVSAVLLLLLLILPLMSGDAEKPGLKPGPEFVEIGPSPRLNSQPPAVADSGTDMARREIARLEETEGSLPRTLPPERAETPPTIEGGTPPIVAAEPEEAASESELEPGPDTASVPEPEPILAQARPMDENGPADEGGTAETESSAGQTEPMPSPETATASASADQPVEPAPATTDRPPAAADSTETIPSAPESSPSADQSPEPEPQSASGPEVASAEPENGPEKAATTEEEPKTLDKKPIVSSRREEPPPSGKAEKPASAKPKPVKRAVKTVPNRKTAPRRLTEIIPVSSPDGFEALIKAGGTITEYRSFFLKSPPKLVIDIQGVWELKTGAVTDVRDDLVKRIRVGEHPDFIRVVVDLKGDGPLEPAFTETSEGLRVSLHRNSG